MSARRASASRARCDNCGARAVSHVLQVELADRSESFALRSCPACWPALRSIALTTGGVLS